jgi:hypothetical protein
VVQIVEMDEAHDHAVGLGRARPVVDRWSDRDDARHPAEGWILPVDAQLEARELALAGDCCVRTKIPSRLAEWARSSATTSNPSAQ